MAVKTFTANEVLTASDTNTYLNNGGLVYVTQLTFTGQTAVNIDACFNSTMDNYRLVIDISALSANDTIAWNFRDAGGNVTSANYDWTMLEWYSGSVAASTSLAQGSSRLQFSYSTPGYVGSILDIYNPNAARNTVWTSNSTSMNSTTWNLVDRIDGYFRLNTAFTGFRLFTGGGTATMTGRIRVYGYRNA